MVATASKECVRYTNIVFHAIGHFLFFNDALDGRLDERFVDERVVEDVDFCGRLDTSHSLKGSHYRTGS